MNHQELNKKFVRIMIDTNIIISLMFSKNNDFKKIIETIKNKHILVLPQIILDELGKLSKGKLISKKYQINSFIQNTLFEKTNFSLVNEKVIIRDKDDEKILASALLSKCDVFVTGDKDFYDHKSYRSLEIISPKEFLALFCS